MKFFQAFLAVAMILAVLGAARFSTIESAPQDVATEIAELKDRCTKLEERCTKAEARAKELEEFAQKSREWFDALPALCNALDQKMESARTNGFEKAGPNPEAKKDVLDGLKAFAKSLPAKTPAVADKK